MLACGEFKQGHSLRLPRRDPNSGSDTAAGPPVGHLARAGLFLALISPRDSSKVSILFRKMGMSVLIPGLIGCIYGQHSTVQCTPMPTGHSQRVSHLPRHSLIQLPSEGQVVKKTGALDDCPQSVSLRLSPHPADCVETSSHGWGRP